MTKDFELALLSGKQADYLKLDWRKSWDVPINIRELGKYNEDRGYPDLLINCDGFNPVTAVLGALISPKWVSGNVMREDLKGELETGDHIYQTLLKDKEWDSENFLLKYKNHFNTQYIGEIFCRMAFITPIYEDLKKINLPTKTPDFTVPEVLIHCTSTRTAKLWKNEYWAELLDWCQDNKIKIGLIGASPEVQIDEYNSANNEERLLHQYGANGSKILTDLRGKTSLIELAGACKAAKAVITVDAGPLHVAAAVGTPVMGIFGNDEKGVGASPIRLWLPPTDNVCRTISTNYCSKCIENSFKNNDCLLDNHYCMEGVKSGQVIRWLQEVI